MYKMTDKITELPWVYQPNPVGSAYIMKQGESYGEPNTAIAHCPIEDTLDGREEWYKRKLEIQANAQFIVKAVNNLDMLVELIEMMASFIEIAVNDGILHEDSLDLSNSARQALNNLEGK